MSRTLVNILFIFFVILLVINVFAFKIFESTNTPVTFENLLEQVSNAPTLDLELTDVVKAAKINYDGDVKILQSLVNIVNSLLSVIGFLVWIGSLAIDLISYIVYMAYLLGLSAFSAWI